MKKSFFTLVELLVVIAIIGILASLSIMAIGGAIDSAKVSAARTQMMGIKKAVEEFYQQYGQYPTVSDLKTSTTYIVNGNTNTTDYDNLISVLAFRCCGGSSDKQKTQLISKSLNPKAIRFLEVPAEFERTGYRLVDPWGHPYVILMDVDESERVNFTGTGSDAITSGVEKKSVNGRVHVISYGPDETDDVLTNSDYTRTYKSGSGDVTTWMD